MLFSESSVVDSVKTLVHFESGGAACSLVNACCKYRGQMFELWFAFLTAYSICRSFQKLVLSVGTNCPVVTEALIDLHNYVRI